MVHQAQLVMINFVMFIVMSEQSCIIIIIYEQTSIWNKKDQGWAVIIK